MLICIPKPGCNDVVEVEIVSAGPGTSVHAKIGGVFIAYCVPSVHVALERAKAFVAENNVVSNHPKEEL